MSKQEKILAAPAHPLLRRIETPAFVYEEERLEYAVRVLDRFGTEPGCQVLFALKPFTVCDALHLMVPHLDGFAASSLFEATLARDVIGDRGTVHITTPGFRADEMEAVADICDYVAFNSLSQWKRFSDEVSGKASCGLRVNPQLPFIKDDRYNPCRKHSKLGVPLDQLVVCLEDNPAGLKGVEGLLFHTNCDATDFSQLLATVRHVEAHLAALLHRVEWINLGGGYLFEEADDLTPFFEAVNLLRSRYHLTVFIEPGAAMVRRAGFLVSTVLDLFTSDGKTIAVLDTTVNHMPEVFEYQFAPDVIGDVEDGRYEYILAGCSCLAGDVFGDYAFNEPLELGSRVVFSNAGAYTLVKAHMFNGINLPAIYALTETGELVLKKRFTYEDFASRNGARQHAAI